MELTKKRLEEYNLRITALNKELSIGLAAEALIVDGKIVSRVTVVDTTPVEKQVLTSADGTVVPTKEEDEEKVA